jgi:hypothetical protein
MYSANILKLERRLEDREYVRWIEPVYNGVAVFDVENSGC